MTYFVVLPTGEKYGPADVQTLQQWVQEGRVKPEAMLQDAVTGQYITANQVPGLQFGPPAAGFSAPPNYAQYHRNDFGGSAPSWIETQFLNSSMVLMVILCFCCALPMLVFSVVGYFMSNHPEAKRRALICICVSGVWVAVGTIGRIFGAVFN